MLISVVTPTYNERDNIEPLYIEIKNIFKNINLDYEHIVIDNCSTDGTVEILKKIAKNDKNFKVILNQSNFGHIRSPFHGLINSSGDATIIMCSDFQHPPKLIEEYIKKWKMGSKVILGQKIDSKENYFKKKLRNLYYFFLNLISRVKIIPNTTGDGLYDSSVIKHLKNINDPSPFTRGLVHQLGYKVDTIRFIQQKRLSGYTKNNIFTLFDMGIDGIIKHSNLPIRIFSFIGLLGSLTCLIISLYYLINKILFWYTFSAGTAPLLVGVFGMLSLILLMLGLIGEYLIKLLEYNRKLPRVIEEKRINF